MKKRPAWTRNQKILLIGTILLPCIFFISQIMNGEKLNNQSMNNSPGGTQVMGNLNYFPPESKNDRPYLSMILKLGKYDYLRRNGNSQLYFADLHDENFLVFPIEVKNIDKLHVTNVMP